MDRNDIPCVAVFATCSDTEIHKLCYRKPLYGNTKGEDILNTLIDRFEKRGVNIRKIFAVTTDGAPAMVVKIKGFTKMDEDKAGTPL